MGQRKHINAKVILSAMFKMWVQKYFKYFFNTVAAQDLNYTSIGHVALDSSDFRPDPNKTKLMAPTLQMRELMLKDQATVQGHVAGICWKDCNVLRFLPKFNQLTQAR